MLTGKNKKMAGVSKTCPKSQYANVPIRAHGRKLSDMANLSWAKDCRSRRWRDLAWDAANGLHKAQQIGSLFSHSAPDPEEALTRAAAPVNVEDGGAGL
jgi:hypothetical protein